MSEIKTWQEWISKELKRYRPDLVETCHHVLRNYDQIKRNGKVKRSNLERIILAARSDDEWLNNLGTELLGKLAINYEEARKAILEMVSDRNLVVRVNALKCLHPRIPKKLTFMLLSKGINDKNALVRMFAAYKSQKLKRRDLIPLLEARLVVEQSVRAKFEIEMMLAFLRDGYFLMKGSDNEDHYIWVANQQGLAGYPIAQDEINQKGFQALAAEKIREERAIDERQSQRKKI